MQPREHRQVYRKAESVGQDVRPCGPDVLRGFVIVVTYVSGLLFHAKKGRIQDVGVGGSGHFAVDFPNQGYAHINAPEHGIGRQIGFQRRQQRQRASQAQDGAQ